MIASEVNVSNVVWFEVISRVGTLTLARLKLPNQNEHETIECELQVSHNARSI